MALECKRYARAGPPLSISQRLIPNYMFPSEPSLISVTTNAYNSDIATADTIRLMQQISYEYAFSPVVIQAVHEAIARLPSNANDKDRARAIFYWIKQRVHFTSDENIILNGLHKDIDENGTDLLITPEMLLTMPQAMGDCDDYSMLGASMLIALGMRPKFVTIAADRNDPYTFSHVYVVVYIGHPTERLVLDFSHGICPSWEYKNATRIQEW